MGASSEGWRALADYLRVTRQARWEGLPPEAVAEEAWPFFKRAVAAALREGRDLPGNAGWRRESAIEELLTREVATTESRS